jgi:hypothetical protein
MRMNKKKKRAPPPPNLLANIGTPEEALFRADARITGVVLYE